MTRKSGNLPEMFTCSDRVGRVGSGLSAKVTSLLRNPLVCGLFFYRLRASASGHSKGMSR